MRFGIQRSSPRLIGTSTIAHAVTVTLALGLLGAVVESAVGTGLLVATLVVLNSPSILPLVDGFLVVVAGIGAVFGGISLPLAAWAFPTVAVGRIAATTSVATAAGGILGFATSDGPAGLILGAGIGYVYGTSWLATRSRRTPTAGHHHAPSPSSRETAP